MTKTELRKVVGFNTATLSIMSKGDYVSLKTIDNICQFLDCEIYDVIEIIHKKS